LNLLIARKLLKMSSLPESSTDLLPINSSFRWFDCKKVTKLSKMSSLSESVFQTMLKSSDAFPQPVPSESLLALPFTQPKAKNENILDEPSPSSITACFDDPHLVKKIPTISIDDCNNILESSRVEKEGIIDRDKLERENRFEDEVEKEAVNREDPHVGSVLPSFEDPSFVDVAGGPLCVQPMDVERENPLVNHSHCDSNIAVMTLLNYEEKGKGDAHEKVKDDTLSSRRSKKQRIRKTGSDPVIRKHIPFPYSDGCNVDEWIVYTVLSLCC
jgi:hypothetical protein